MAVPGPPAAGSPAKPFSTSGISVPRVSGTSAGDLVLVAFEKELVGTVTPPVGLDFAELGTAPSTTGKVHQLHLFWRRSAGDDPTTYDFVFSDTAPYAEGVALRIPGALASGDPTEAVQGAARSSNGETTPSVSLTTSGADRLVVWVGANYNGGSWSPPSGFTERYDGGTCLSVATMSMPTAGSTGSVSGACSTSDYATARLLAVLPSTGQSNRGIPIGVLL